MYCADTWNLTLIPKRYFGFVIEPPWVDTGTLAQVYFWQMKAYELLERGYIGDYLGCNV